MMRLMGAVLAGGRSSRFGSDKAQAMLEGRSLLEHAVEALGHHVETVVVCGRQVEGMIGLADRPAADMGPLGGLNAALHHAMAEGYDAVLTTGCDVPAYPDGLAEALIGQGAAILQGQQLAGFWPASLAGLVKPWSAAPAPCHCGIRRMLEPRSLPHEEKRVPVPG